jgi:hypothetical protein
MNVNFVDGLPLSYVILYIVFVLIRFDCDNVLFFACLGPYGYRAPGSDYGDHGRRINGAWGADSGDDASETSSICSERSLEVCRQKRLVGIRLC